MTRFTGFAAAVLAVAVTPMVARAAAPVLPPDAIEAQTVMVAYADATHFSPQAVRSAAQAVLGQNAKRADDSLQKFQERFDKLTQAGVDAVTLVGPGQKPRAAAAPADPAGRAEEHSEPITYFHLKDGADVKAIEGFIRDGMEGEKRTSAVFEQRGQFLALRTKEQPLPAKGDAARARMFADSLATIADAALQISIIPNAQMREQMNAGAADLPPGVKEAVPSMARSKWITVAISFGNKPAITATATTAEAADAKQVFDGLNTAIANVKQPPADGPAPSPAAGMIAGMLAPIVDSLKPTQNGNQVSVSLRGQALTMIGGFAMQFGGGGQAPGHTAHGRGTPNSAGPGGQSPRGE